MTIPDFEELDQTSFRLSQIRVSLSTISSDHTVKKRLLPAILLAYRLYRIIRIIRRGKLGLLIRIAGKRKLKSEKEEILRSGILRLACEAWHKLDRGVNNQRLPPCPCKKSQADGDDRYTRENIIQDIWREKIFKRTTAKSCYRQSNVG